ncbi:hypothetical protein K435DRAFT_781618 [Dendrothele bispora CBS 962.96]|uniref:DUF7704 domain-containing protein n=1 Tax=Dendrothele bispora (strain CBS 962.96) TaxID=1314807 RepID=A0A4S8LJT3_DENBC|nr:hypothetical protein K435DRAFT_781618 [Dendrothele bispora CBS 962.96]
MSPALLIWFWPGASWFHHGLVPSSSVAPPLNSLDPRTILAVWQLGGCYMLLGLISSIVFRAIRDTLRSDPIAQERIIGAALTALAIADVFHIITTFIGLPSNLRYAIVEWNATTHGNITITTFLFVVRCAWFLGIGRRRYYYGQSQSNKKRQ